MTRDSRSRQALRFLGSAALMLAFLTVALPIHAADEPDFKAKMKQVIAAWGTLDPGKAAPYYSKEANAVFFDIAPLKYVGWSAYAAGTAAMFSEWTSLTMAINDDVKIDRHGDVAITTATGRAEFVGKDGSKGALEWRSTLVWKKTGKEWLIAHEHFSTPLPEPAPAAATPAK